MSVSALLDTSFLISLVTKTRSHHKVAERYYRYMQENEIAMYFSVIAVSEFAVKQSIHELPLQHFKMLHFNAFHGQCAATLWAGLGHREQGDSRHIVRDDVKLIAQAHHEDIPLILTDDSSTLYKYCDRLRESGLVQACAVVLKDGFDDGHFDEDRQRKLFTT